ncbi:MAG: M20 family metallopeptidase [Firmicutes bacterium]|nr:M20 family metallopeptidase [Bacillota bacterium]
MAVNFEEIRNRIIAYADEHGEEYKSIALAIHGKPEVSNYEFFACEALSNKLKEAGFEIELNAAEHRTGFAASYKSEKPGPTLVFLAEYDALAGLGHGCGHNIFGAVSSLAGAALKSVIDETGGEVRVYGTPGEEGGEKGSSKGDFVDCGYFKDVDAALCEHPGSSPENTLSSPSNTCAPVDIEFRGKPAHAAGAPYEGLNALDAQILVYNAISVLRQQLTTDVRVHGIITDGGTAPNIIPEYTRSKWFLRAADKKTAEDLFEKVKNIVEGAALQTGTKGSIKPYQHFVDNEIVTESFDALFEKNLKLFGLEITHKKMKVSGGSTDVGNVSQVVPTIQPHLSITDEKIPGHSHEMVAASCSERGLSTIPLGAKVLALTALDLIEDPALLAKIKEEHKYNVEHQAEIIKAL